jgi:hypothetical protein
MMRIPGARRGFLLLISAVAAIGLPLGVMTAPASAAATHPVGVVAKNAPRVVTNPAGFKPDRFAESDASSDLMCLTANTNECWTTQGAGNQIQDTIGGTGFNLTAVTSTSGYYKIHVNNSQNCITSSGNEVVSSACATGAENQWWGAGTDGGPGCLFSTFNDGTDRATVFNTDNKPVWYENNGSALFNWSTGLWSGC